MLAANTLCGAEPEGWITTTTLYLDRDYVIDQVYRGNTLHGSTLAMTPATSWMLTTRNLHRSCVSARSVPVYYALA